MFYCKGPAFREDVVLEEGKLIDEAPTIARAMGFDMPDTDGAPVFDLLK